MLFVPPSAPTGCCRTVTGLRNRAWPIRWASTTAVAALLAILATMTPPGPFLPTVFFYIFSATALAGAVLTVTSRNPIYSALWFASVVLSTTGLFLLANAPFLAAGTIIVYAGAIIVTFLFVIMLAQMEGKALYDRAARAPGAATLTCFLLLWCLIYSLSALDDAPGSAGSGPGPALTDQGVAQGLFTGTPERVAGLSWTGPTGRHRGFTTRRATRSKMSPVWARHSTQITWSRSGSPASCCSWRLSGPSPSLIPNGSNAPCRDESIGRIARFQVKNLDSKRRRSWTRLMCSRWIF